MQYKVWFPKFKPIKKTSGYALYLFEKDDLEKILKDWNNQAYWLLKNNPGASTVQSNKQRIEMKEQIRQALRVKMASLPS